MVWEIQQLRPLTKKEKSEEELRRRLPYGMWTCENGREVLFNRFYQPIWERIPGQCATAADPVEWVRWTHQEWFFDDRTSPWFRADKEVSAATRARCEAILASWGVGRSTRTAA